MQTILCCYFRVRGIIVDISLTKNRELIVHSFTSNILNVLSKMIMERGFCCVWDVDGMLGIWMLTMGKMFMFSVEIYNNNAVDCYFFTFSERENVLCKGSNLFTKLGI